jgi:hypothetical protein
MGKKHYVYCETCERDVFLQRKNFDHMYHEVLIIFFIITLSIGYWILRFRKKKNTCPNCESEFDLNNLPPPSNPNPIRTDLRDHKII